MGWRSLALGLACLALAASACARPQPDARETVVLRSPSDAVPAYLREVVSGKTIYINVLPEMRPFTIDYLRAAGAIVVDRWPAELQIETRLRSDTATYPSGGFSGASRTGSPRTIIDVELSGLRKDGARQLLLQGRGEAVETAGGIARAIDLAGRRALLNLH
jgi:hypothetical protein